MTALPVDAASADAPIAHGHMVCFESAPCTGDDVRAAVALHVAATILPARTPLDVRETVRGNWFRALNAVMDVREHWALAYVPGVDHSDNEVYAVHLPTGAVFGGEGHPTGQQYRESTSAWLDRLSPLVLAD